MPARVRGGLQNTMPRLAQPGSNIIPFPMQAKSIPLPAGDKGVALTIDAMASLVTDHPEGARNPQVRAWALQAIAGAPARNDVAQASAIYYAVKKNIKFVGEYSETVQTPLLTLQLGAGDCDDHATLIVALLRAIGIPARFDTVAVDPDGQFVHVFAVALIRQNGRVVSSLALDTTVDAATPGWRPPIITRERVWPVTGKKLGLGDSQQDAQNAAAVITSVGNSVAQVVSAVRNTGNTGTLSLQRTPGGVAVGAGASTEMVLGALLLGGVAIALLGRRR